MTFETRYAKLNDNQRRAVDTVYGPLLVVAGPGTGKTELLSMRAAQILRQTDTLPSNILCLTFTDSGAANMRSRLRDIIGEDAYKVAIHTFHSFGTDIIARHRDYFFRGADMKPMDELTQHQTMQQLFNELVWDSPLATKYGDEFTYLRDAMSVISEFKQSGLNPNELRQIADDNERIMAEITPRISELFAGRISKSILPQFAALAEYAAEMSQQALPSAITSYAKVITLSLAHAAQHAIADNSTKPITAWKNQWCAKQPDGATTLKDALALEKFRATIDLYERYNAALHEAKRFDYDDMILSVLQACDTHPDLRATLQEQYQFIMIDEFQDTNLAQLRLLFQLTGQGSEPNVMAVGDDDQAIFSFQGADIGNIQRFREQYDNPPIIVLTDNYRSASAVLTASRAVITQGVERLERTVEGLSKQLTPHAPDTGAAVSLRQYATPPEEQAGVAKQIAALIADGTPAEAIAVLARRHYELIELLPYLAKEGIAVNYERHDDALAQPVVKALEVTARAVQAIANSDHDAANAYLPELVAQPAFHFAPEDIWRLSLQAYRNRQSWLETMLAMPVFTPLAQWLLARAAATQTTPLEQQIDALLGLTDATDGVPTLSGYFFSAERLAAQPDAYLSALEALRTIRDALRSHYDTDAPALKDFLQFIDLHRTMHARLSVNRLRADTTTGAVHLMTAHKSKGLEFPHVFIIGATDAGWGEKARGKSRLISYPANLPLAPAGANYDERLRLFFVAMTRAKTTLSISYAATNHNAKDTLIASFLSTDDAAAALTDITPIEASGLDIQTATALLETDWRARLTAPITTDLRAVLAPTLERYKLSATHLNNFLDVSRGGPQSFLLNNLLRFPQAKSPSAGYGTAIHAALQFTHDSLRADGTLPPRQATLDYFTRQLTAQHLSADDLAALTDKGHATLNAFLDARQDSFEQSQLTEVNFSAQNVVLGEARLTGALDLADIDTTAKTIFVTDYKTGKPSPSWKGSTDSEKIKLHKYRQQLLFYQLLIKQSRDYSNYAFTGGRLQFVEPHPRTGEILALEEQFSDEKLAEFARLIDAVWRRIMTLDLPDISGYSADYKGMLAFEADLLHDVA
ncbi:MAG: ATP-dependent DNA helicase [Candidatus Saccharibacteria bacterium]|nr:ATP-dependent DNA helicase [Candidatus Saccharibacteria bacterium]